MTPSPAHARFGDEREPRWVVQRIVVGRWQRIVVVRWQRIVVVPARVGRSVVPARKRVGREAEPRLQ